MQDSNASTSGATAARASFGAPIRVWWVTDGTADAQGWLQPMVDALRAGGVRQVDVLTTSGMLTETARGLLEQGAELLQRTFRVQGSSDGSDARELMARHRPDLVVADHPGVLRWLDLLREATRSPALHVGVFGAWEAPDAWLSARADALVVCDEEHGTALRRSGYTDANLRVAGPPVSPAFLGVNPQRTAAAAALRQELGVAPEDWLVLVDASAMTPMQVETLLAGMSGRPQPHLLVYWGRHRIAADAFRAWAEHYRVRARMFGWVSDPERYAAAADAVLVTPQVPLLTGYLGLGKPVISLQPAVDPLKPWREGAIVPIAEARAAAEVLAWIAASGPAATHRDAAAALAGWMNANAGAPAVVQALASLYGDRDALRTRVRAPMASTAPRSGAFEDIGAGVPQPAGSGSAMPEPSSRDQAREQLASLILQERKLEGRISEVANERDRWMERMELARQSGDSRLHQAAQDELDRTIRQLADLNEQLASLERQKDLVRRRAATTRSGAVPPPSAGSAVEDEFRRLERQRDLDRLRNGDGPA